MMRESLEHDFPSTLLFENTEGRRIAVDLTPDGLSSWLLRVRADGRVLFDCGGRGVVGVDAESLAKVVVSAFRVLDHRPN